MITSSKSGHSKRLFAIVLAAGTASRFRTTKQLAEYAGEPLVCHAVRLAETLCEERSILVTGCDWQQVQKACAPLKGFVVRNEAHESGMASSIACGARAASGVADAVLLLLADQPLISAANLEQMVIAWNESDSRIVCSEFAGIAGPPVIFPARYFEALGRLEGDQGARALLDVHREHVVGIPCDAAATDIDTPEDLLNLQT